MTIKEVASKFSLTKERNKIYFVSFVLNEENKDITEIKEAIDEINNPKLEPIVPDYNMSPKDFFQQNKILMLGDSLVEN